jgi:hypothetical protein
MHGRRPRRLWREQLTQNENRSHAGLPFSYHTAFPDESWTQQRTVTGIAQIFSAVSGTQIDRYNFETLVLARDVLADWVRATKEARCGMAQEIDHYPCDGVRGYFIHLSLQNIEDEEVRRALSG